MAALRPTAIRALQAQRGAFRPSAPAMSVRPQFQPHVDRFSVENVTKYVVCSGVMFDLAHLNACLSLPDDRWLPSFALWGAAAGGAVTLFLSPVPIFQADVLKKIPVVSTYFEGASGKWNDTNTTIR